jgi:hypothetical protein
MKLILIIFAALLFAGGSGYAQEYKYEARLGWIPGDILTFFTVLGEDGETSWGPLKTVGIFSADFDVKMKPWLTVGGKANYRHSWRDQTRYLEEGVVKNIDRTEVFSVMPTVKFTSMQDDTVFRVYAAVGLGPGIIHTEDYTKYYTAFQFTPGMAVGNKISWYLELGLGNAWCGLITGLGWRF